MLHQHDSPTVATGWSGGPCGDDLSCRQTGATILRVVPTFWRASIRLGRASRALFLPPAFHRGRSRSHAGRSGRWRRSDLLLDELSKWFGEWETRVQFHELELGEGFPGF